MISRGPFSTKVKLRYFLLISFSAALLVSNQAQAAVLYGHDNSHKDTDPGGGRLYQIDTVAQSVTPVGLVGSDARKASGPDIEMSPDQSTIYMSRALWSNNEFGQSMFLIDPATGENIRVLSLSGVPPGRHIATALEFAGEALYAAFHRGAFLKD